MGPGVIIPPAPPLGGPGPDLHLVGPLALWDFRNIFLPNTDKTKVSLI